MTGEEHTWDLGIAFKYASSSASVHSLAHWENVGAAGISLGEYTFPVCHTRFARRLSLETIFAG